MDEKNKTPVKAEDDTVNQVKILRSKIGPLAAQTEFVADAGEESIGFDPYDTASLYVQKTAGEQ
jgi:hypothetical protein